MKRLAAALALSTAFLVARPPVLAQAEDPDAYGDDYQKGDYGRVRHVENGAIVVRAQGNEVGRTDDASLTVNAPVYPGDALRTGRDQRVEVQLAGGTLIRQDDNGQTTFVSLPSPGAKYQDNTVLKLAFGTLRIVAKVGDEESFRVDTPAASIYVLGDADVRVDVDPAGSTRVLSHRGVVEVVGDGGSVLVRGGTRSSVEPGSVPSDPRAFNTFASDLFDRWCEQRDDANRIRDRYAGSGDGSYAELPYEVRPYYNELSSYGRWVVAPGYGSVWYPYDVAPGWRPYYDGYWNYGPGGYFWVSNEPWGWAPYHYGRWSWVVGFGWCWAPGRVFGGAWVSWSWGAAHVGWAPLDYWGGPAYIGNPWYGYYDPGCWTFVGYDHFGHHDYHHHAVPLDRVGSQLRGTAPVARAPRVSPQRLASGSDVDVARNWAVREAANDRGARMRPITRDRAPETKFREQEDRWIERRRAGSKSGDVPRDSRPVTPRLNRAGTPLASPATGSRERQEAPDRARVQATERGTGSRTSRMAPGAVDRSRDSGASANGGHARRILDDPRSKERARESSRRPEAPPAPGTGIEQRGSSPRTGVAPREEPPRDTRERVRDMYRQLSRPRETDGRRQATEVRPSAPSQERRDSRAPRAERAAPQSKPEAPRVERSRPQSPPPSRDGGGSGRARPKEPDRHKK